MKKEDLELQIKELEEAFNSKKSAICIAYCKANNWVKVGDAITNRHGESILVDRITFTFGCLRFNPECVYHGIELKKDLTARKDGRRSTFYQSNLVDK